MALLTFNKEGGNWVAYFKAEADFALHIERDEAGVMSMEQSTTGGGYAVVEDFPARSRYGRAFDYEFSALVYPKFIRIASITEPTFAAVTTDGEITEIKSQSKEVEVTANGTMDITPDAGFSYLNSVKVKTNVAQSGGGGGSASSVEYWDFRGTSGLNQLTILLRSIAVKGTMQGMKGIFPSAMFQQAQGSGSDVTAIAIDLSFEMVAEVDGVIQTITVKQQLEQNNINIAAIPRITKEEFYNLNA